MKKIFTLITILVTTAVSSTAHQGNMTFAGKSKLSVSMGDTQMFDTESASDTVIYSGSDFVFPSMKYENMVIPSFTVKGTQFTGDHSGVMWEDQTWTATTTDASGTEKTFTGSSLQGKFSHEGGIYKLTLKITFKYGLMPMPITYEIEGYYVKPTVNELSMLVGGSFGPYTNSSVTYDARKYIEDGITKLDVKIHEHTLPATVMGDITMGEYTVRGLVYDDEKAGFYRDYSQDGITFHFKTSQGLDNDYGFDKGGNLLVKMNGADITYAVNSFQPGSMPFPIVATFGSNDATSISMPSVDAQTDKPKKYFSNGKIVISKNGKKYTTTGIILK